MTFEVDGFDEFSDELEEFADDLDEIRHSLPDVLDEAVEEAAEDLAGEMKLQLHKKGAVDSGRLLKSIRVDQDRSARRGGVAQWSTGPTADYAKHVEYGTGTRGDPQHASGNEYYITPKGTTMSEIRQKIVNTRGEPGLGELEDAPALVIDGTPVLYVQHPGSKATPFWRDAIRKHETEGRLADSIDKHTSELFRGAMR